MNANLKKKDWYFGCCRKKENPKHILSLHDCPPHDVVGSVEERRGVRSVNDVNMCFVLSISRQTPKYQSKTFWKLTFLLYIPFLCMIVLPMMLLEVWKRDSLGGVIVWSGKVLKDGSPVFQSNTFSGDRLFYHSYQRQKGQIKWKRNRKIDHSLFCHQWSLLDWTNFGSWGSWRGPFLTMRWTVLN